MIYVNVGSSSVNIINAPISAYTSAAKARSGSAEAPQASRSRDTFEISSPNYAAYAQNQQAEQPYALSGSDSLKIAQSGKNGSKLIIHFADSAQLARTVENGYLYVNGVRIELSDSVKKLLTAADKAVQTNKRLAAESQTMKENMDAAKNQTDAMEKQMDKMNKAFEIANRIAKGGKVPPEDEQLLMDINPGLYMMSKLAAMTAKKHKKYETLIEEEEPSKPAAEAEQTVMSYETQMCVSIDGAPAVESVSAAETER